MRSCLARSSQPNASKAVSVGRRPGDYYVMPFSEKRIRLPHSFRNRAEILAFIDGQMPEIAGDVFCSSSWCAALVNRGSGAYVWDVLFCDKSSNTKDRKPWKLTRIYDRASSSFGATTWPDCAYIDRGKLVLQTRNGRRLATLRLPRG